MMRLPVFILLSFLFSHSANAQDSLRVNWGEDIKLSKDERHLEIIGAGPKFFYTTKDLYGSTDKFILEKYAVDSLNRVFSKEVILPEVNGAAMSFEKLLFTKNQFLLFTSVYNSSTETISAYCTPMSTNGDWLDLPTLVDDFESKRWNPGEYDVMLSPDSSLFMVYHKMRFQKKANDTFSFNVYSLSLDLLWNKRLELPYSSGSFEIDQYLLDDNGNVLLLSGMSPEKEEADANRQKTRKKKYVLFTYSWAENKLKEFNVNLKDKWIISATCALTKEGNICIGGFYSKDQHFTIGGSFFFTMNGQSREVMASGLMAFDKALLNEFLSDRHAERGNELSDFYFDHLVIKPDGSAYMIAEQFYISERITTDPNTGMRVVTYYYNYQDILVLKVKADGQIEWANKIAKDQSTADDKGVYSSYALFESADKLHFLFNDHGDNLTILLDEPSAQLRSFSNSKRSVATVVSIDGAGAMKRTALFSHRDSGTILRPRLYYQLDRSNGVIYGQFKKSYRFGKLMF